jgi:hypothetical protein
MQADTDALRRFNGNDGIKQQVPLHLGTGRWEMGISDRVTA